MDAEAEAQMRCMSDDGFAEAVMAGVQRMASRYVVGGPARKRRASWNLPPQPGVFTTGDRTAEGASCGRHT